MSAMNPFIDTQVRATIEGIRLLETILTAPLGLYSDIKMLREALPFPEAGELSRDETRERRILYSGMTDAHLEVALDTVESIERSLAVLDRLKDGPETAGISRAWTEQAGRVLDRARQKAGGDLRAGTAARVRGLGVLIGPDETGGRPATEVCEAVLQGGAGVLLLDGRTGHTGHKGTLLSLARDIAEMCGRYGALFLVSADADIAAASGAHGFHTHRSGLPVADARRLLAPPQLLGRSNSTAEQALESQAQSVDYVAVGPVFETAQGRPAVGVEGLRSIRELVDRPILASGGIDVDNIAQVVGAGADCVGVQDTVTQAPDPEAATRALVEAIDTVHHTS